MAVQIHSLRLGDTLTPLGVQLKQENTSGVLAVVDLTGKTVKFLMVDQGGTSVVAETASNVTVTDEDNGIVQYDFQADDVDTAGEYFAYFRVYSGSERDTYPVAPGTLIVSITSNT